VDDGQLQQPTVEAIWTARRRIEPYVRKTPLEHSAPLSDAVGSDVWLKLECLQETGSFKVRGAANAITRLPPGAQRRGVITFSTGNHGRAVATMARRLGLNATVCVPHGVDAAKAEAIRRQGATLVVEGIGQDEAEHHCYRLAEETGAIVINPFDDPFVIAGQGTIGLELLEERPQIGTVVVPVSGGGLISGIALALKHADPRIEVVGASMEGGAAMYHSLAAGAPVTVDEVATLADSLQGGIGDDNRYTFSIVRRLVDDLVLVSEQAIAGAMTLLFAVHRLVVEGGAAVGVAAILEGKVRSAGRDVVVVVSGRNVDPQRYLDVVARHLHSTDWSRPG
jgi:threonine dehydratase